MTTPQAEREWEANVPPDYRRRYLRTLEGLIHGQENVLQQTIKLHSKVHHHRYRTRVNNKHRIVFDRLEDETISLVAFRYRNHKDQHYDDLVD